MPDDKKELAPEQAEDNALLENIEATLHDMRGDDSYDDTDSMDDTAESLDQRPDEHADDEEKKANEETKGQDGTTEDDAAPAGKETAEAGEPEGEGGNVPAEPDAKAPDSEVSQAEIDAADDKLMESFTNERTSERFQQFRDENKQQRADLDELQGKHTELEGASSTLFTYLDESHTQPEQLSAQLAINKAVNTGDFSQVRPAYERMQQMMAVVATGLGDNAHPAPLSDELQASVDNLDITPELAQKYARQEAQQNLHGQYQQRAQQQTMEHDQVAQDKHQAAADIKIWEKTLAIGDPDFAGKQQQMLLSAKEIMSTTHPTQWLSELKREYRVITATQARVAEQQQRAKAKANAPIRPGGGGPNINSASPSSFEENFNSTLRDIRPNAE